MEDIKLLYVIFLDVEVIISIYNHRYKLLYVKFIIYRIKDVKKLICVEVDKSLKCNLQAIYSLNFISDKVKLSNVKIFILTQ